MSKTQTSASVLTAHSRGAIAVVKVSGADAVDHVDRYFHTSYKPFRESLLNQIRFGRWNGATGEELVAIRTAEDEVEIHCHGGISASRAIVENLHQAGVQSVAAHSLSDRKESLETAAWQLLSRATTERTAAIFLDQAKGAFSQRLNQTIQLLKKDSSKALGELRHIVSWKQLSEHLIQPWQVLLAGPPNVGKSSLINALVGYERAIVYDMPGTTRDAVSAMTAIKGWPVQLFDTAGLRDSSDTIESAGIAITKQMFETADLIIAVNDPDHLEWQLPSQARNKPLIRVANKSDLATEQTNSTYGVATSAVTGEGIQSLLDLIDEKLIPLAPQPGDAVPFLEWHFEILDTALDQVEAGKLEAAIESLQSLLAVR